MLSEFDLIRRYFTRPAPHSVLGIGDDCALLRVAPGMDLAVSTDMLIEGRHFAPDADPESLGHKALAVNLSDIAAMGGTPRWVTLSLALPEAEERWLEAFARGFLRLADRFEVDLVGGDTTRGPRAICVQIMGEVPAGAALRRDGARPGDDIWVSGEIGDAALLLAHLQHRITLAPNEVAACMPRLHEPEPRLALGRALLGVANSAIDLSDGLAADLGHILERSGVAAEIELARIPRSHIMNTHLAHPEARQSLLAGGDDYELCFTASPDQRATVEAAARSAGMAVTRIGRAQPGAGLTILDEAGRTVTLEQTGYDHFGTVSKPSGLVPPRPNHERTG